MDKRNQLVGTWIGLASIILFGLAFWPWAGFLPPLSPSLTAAEVTEIFQSNTNGIRFGMILMMFAGSTNAVFVAVVATQLKRIEKKSSIWTYTELVAGGGNAIIIVVGAMLMTAAVFRPDRGADLNYLLFDLSWIMIIMPGIPAAVQTFAVGFAILGDTNSPPVFPRWVGFYSIWAALLYLPGALLTFFKSGPFAWNGLIAFWVGAAAFGSWYVVMFFMLRKAIKQQP